MLSLILVWVVVEIIWLAERRVKIRSFVKGSGVCCFFFWFSVPACVRGVREEKNIIFSFGTKVNIKVLFCALSGLDTLKTSTVQGLISLLGVMGIWTGSGALICSVLDHFSLLNSAFLIFCVFVITMFSTFCVSIRSCGVTKTLAVGSIATSVHCLVLASNYIISNKPFSVCFCGFSCVCEVAKTTC